MWASDGAEAGCATTAPTDLLWNRIIARSGEMFREQRGKPFTYSVDGDSIYLDTTNQDLSRRQITEAYNRVPLVGPKDMRDPRAARGTSTPS